MDPPPPKKKTHIDELALRPVEGHSRNNLIFRDGNESVRASLEENSKK